MAFSRYIVEDQKGESTRTHVVGELGATVVYLETQSKVLHAIRGVGNATEKNYLHIWNADQGVVLGTTVPMMGIPIGQNVTQSIRFSDGVSIFAAGTAVICAQEAGTPGAVPTAPSAAVNFRIGVK